MNIAQKGLVFIIRIYQFTLSPLLLAAVGASGRCRFTPSCSQYAREAIRLHGAWRGGFLAGRRLCRCHPWGGFGEDFPPPAGSFDVVGRALRARRSGQSQHDRVKRNTVARSARPTFLRLRKPGHCHGS